MAEPIRIFIVEDEHRIARFLQMELEHEGFQTATEENGRRAFERIIQEKYDLVLLDIMLPEMDGLTICRQVRELSEVPIIMLTAKDEVEDKVNGLDIGADDYITKPFGLRELNARMEAVLRRSHDDLVPLYKRSVFGDSDLVVDFDSRIVLRKNLPVELTPNEYKIFVALIKHPNKTFTREELIHMALGDDFEGYDRTVDSHIKNLRQKIELDPKNPHYSTTVHGVGYKFGVQ